MKLQHLLHMILAPLLVVIVGISSCGENVWDEVPAPITSFLNQYFPNVGISSYSESNNNYYIELRNDASMSFDVNSDWIVIDGNGSPLPSDLVLDQFPAPLYEYLESIEAAGSVYKVSRTNSIYNVTLFDALIDYDIMTQTVTYHKQTES